VVKARPPVYSEQEVERLLASAAGEDRSALAMLLRELPARNP